MKIVIVMDVAQVNASKRTKAAVGDALIEELLNDREFEVPSPGGESASIWRVENAAVFG